MELEPSEHVDFIKPGSGLDGAAHLLQGNDINPLATAKNETKPLFELADLDQSHLSPLRRLEGQIDVTVDPSVTVSDGTEQNEMPDSLAFELVAMIMPASDDVGRDRRLANASSLRQANPLHCG